VYNIGSGFEVTNKDLVKKILNLMEHDESMMEYVADRPGHDFRYALDSSKLRSLGWQPKYNFDEALDYTVKWYMKNRWSWQ